MSFRLVLIVGTCLMTNCLMALSAPVGGVPAADSLGGRSWGQIKMDEMARATNQSPDRSYPGSIDYGNTIFAVGDTVWVFNAGTDPTMDRNGYILPHEWHEVIPHEGIIIEACHRLRELSTYRVQMFWGTVELECAIAIPQQRAVVIKP